jgi:2-keto-4-pentenoate hydratase/2-oxohepta-3-ene-1,7-dioic acid hydratase in catechol pathway
MDDEAGRLIMRIVRFSAGSEPKFGAVRQDKIEVLAGNPLVDGYEFTGEVHFIGDVHLLAPVTPSKVVCIGKNYADHIDEMGLDANPEPTIFFKPTSSIIGPGENIVLPKQSKRVELEVELTIVIGEQCKNVPLEKALDVVWGFTIANDVTARDLQMTDDQWARSKGFDTFCPIGPWVDTDWRPNGQVLESRVDGHLLQHESISRMLHNVPKIISYVSENMTLLAGDVILTGTPSGISEIHRGEIVECEIEGLGTLLNPVA